MAPEVSLWDWFLSKPLEARPKNMEEYYDSDSDSSDSSDDHDDDEEFDMNFDEDDPFKYYEPKQNKTNKGGKVLHILKPCSIHEPYISLIHSLDRS